VDPAAARRVQSVGSMLGSFPVLPGVFEMYEEPIQETTSSIP
jgi:hypothetical protein